MAAGTFVGLVAENEVGRVTIAFTEIISASFKSHPVRHQTEREVKRRFDMCAKIFEYLRGDLKWGIVRILDKLPEYLGSELNGSSWEPDARTCWMPGDG